MYYLYICIKLIKSSTYYNINMKTNSIKIITLAAKKIMLQKKILKYQEMLKDIDEVIEDDITYKSNFEDFDLIFKKLVFDFKDILNDDDDEDMKFETNNMQVENDLKIN